jgi:hypothetical protein
MMGDLGTLHNYLTLQPCKHIQTSNLIHPQPNWALKLHSAAVRDVRLKTILQLQEHNDIHRLPL